MEGCRVRTILLALAGASLLLGGCKPKPPANTPEAVAQAFADAMAKGDSKAAAALWDFVAQARKDSSDWDEIVPGQRQQILTSMRAQKVDELKGRTGVFAAGMKAGAANASGTTATVEVADGQGASVTVFLAQSDGKWGVSGFASVTKG
jgi:hypothetical protein